MHLFIIELFVDLDSVAPIAINLQKNKQKTLVCSINYMQNYKNNYLTKYLKKNEVKYFDFPPVSLKNRILITFFKLILLLPKFICCRFKGLWYRTYKEKCFLTKSKFISFLKSNNISSITMPSGTPIVKKKFIFECAKIENIKINEIEVGVRTLASANDLLDLPIDYCDYYLTASKLNSYNPNQLKKIKYLGAYRYSNSWLKKLDELNIIQDKKASKLKIGLFTVNRAFQDEKNFISNIKKDNKEIEIKIGHKPRDAMPLKCTNFFHDQFNATQLINWADVIISHSSSILIEAIMKKKMILYCDFIKYDKVFGIRKSHFDEIKSIVFFNSPENLSKYIKNLKIEDTIMEYNDTDLSVINKLRGFTDDSEVTNNYMNFYNNLTK